jgi:hypothetical protein
MDPRETLLREAQRALCPDLSELVYAYLLVLPEDMQQELKLLYLVRRYDPESRLNLTDPLTGKRGLCNISVEEWFSFLSPSVSEECDDFFADYREYRRVTPWSWFWLSQPEKNAWQPDVETMRHLRDRSLYADTAAPITTGCISCSCPSLSENRKCLHDPLVRVTHRCSQYP